MFKTLTSLLACACLASAAAVLSPPVSQCAAASGASGNAGNIFLPFSTWSASGFACEQQEEIFSNFSSSSIPDATVLDLQHQTFGAFDFHTISFDGNFLTDFRVSYDVAVDLKMDPDDLITRVTGDLSNPANVGNPSNLKTVFSESGKMLGSLTSTAGNPGKPIVTANTALHVTDEYHANGGGAVSVANSFGGQETPEPVPFLLVGCGLISLYGFKRKVA